MIIHSDCRFFRGDIPCKPHKQTGEHCAECSKYQKKNEKILIIKLGAIGDVIRTTPLLRRIKDEFPDAYIYWLTNSPEVLSKNWVDQILRVSPETLSWLEIIEFDWIINLDKDNIAIAMAQKLKSAKKNGFISDKYGLARPLATEAENHKWLTGLFDDLNSINTKHYVQEVFEIAGYDFRGEEYILEVKEEEKKINFANGKKIVGLNTGCGGRWISRLYPTEHWITVATGLITAGFEVVLLGGEQEHSRNTEIADVTSAHYFGYFPLETFIALMDECDIIVSAVTMGMHIAIALKKHLVLFNNIFNTNEFYLYNRGEIIEPNPRCGCYFTQTCPHDSMKSIAPERVINAVQNCFK